MTPVEVLKSARELLSDEKRWTKGFIAKDSDGNFLVSPNDRRASSWCALGAIRKFAPRSFDAPEIFERANFFDDDMTFAGWNDRADRTHAEVLAAFDKAIVLAEQEGE